MNDNDISRKDRNYLYDQIRVMLGALDVGVELRDEVLDHLMTISIEEYSAYLNEWLLQQQWGMIQNTPIDTSDLLFALTTKNLEFEKSFSYAYSKQAGIGANSQWELKRDYIVTSASTQLYTIPAGREINEVLWYTPPQIGSSGLGNMPLSDWTSTAFGWNYMGNPAFAVLPSFNMYLNTQDMKMKKNILQSELTYKITAGPNGTKVLHLYPVPGGGDEITGRWGKHYEGSCVWYWYYDTNEDNRDKCLEENNDIALLPNMYPIKTIAWKRLNSSSQAKVRRLLIAEAKIYLGNTRGKFGGKTEGRNGKELTLDYGMFHDQGKTEKQQIYDDLKLFLEKITYATLMQDKATIANSLNDVLKYVPMTNGGMIWM